MFGLAPSVLFRHQVTGKCGSVRVRLIPAPRGTGLVAAPVPKKLLSMVSAPVQPSHSNVCGQRKTDESFLSYTSRPVSIRLEKCVMCLLST